MTTATAGPLERASIKLEAEFREMVCDLSFASNKLEVEFHKQYDQNGRGNINPIRLVQRTKALEKQLETLGAGFEDVLARKKDLCEALQSTILPTADALARVEAAAGVEDCSARDDTQVALGELRELARQVGREVREYTSGHARLLLDQDELNRHLMRDAAPAAGKRRLEPAAVDEEPAAAAGADGAADKRARTEPEGPAGAPCEVVEGGVRVPCALTGQELEAVPQYMRGRLTLERVNAGVEQIREALVAKYAALRQNPPAADRDQLALWKQSETKETKGRYFVTDADIKSRIKLDSSGKATLQVLRHTGRITERIGGGFRRYIVAE